MGWGLDERHALQKLNVEYGCNPEQVADMMSRMFGGRYAHPDRRKNGKKYSMQRFRDEWTQRFKPSKPHDLNRRICDPSKHTAEDIKIRTQLDQDILRVAAYSFGINYLMDRMNCPITLGNATTPATYVCSSHGHCSCPVLRGQAQGPTQPTTSIATAAAATNSSSTTSQANDASNDSGSSVAVTPPSSNPPMGILPMIHEAHLLAIDIREGYTRVADDANMSVNSKGLVNCGGIALKVLAECAGELKEINVMTCVSEVCVLCDGDMEEDMAAMTSTMGGLPFVHERQGCQTVEGEAWQYAFTGCRNAYPCLTDEIMLSTRRVMVRFTDDMSDHITICLMCDPEHCRVCAGL